jgi:DNA-binding LytR/AlgR family response regulator
MIIDDEPDALELIESYVRKTPFLKLSLASTNPLTGIKHLSEKPVDLIFLDVQMPELTGIDFIKSMPGNSRIILCTSYAEYALEGYEHNVVDYLLKPVNYSRFLKAANKAYDIIKANNMLHHKTNHNNFLFIKSEVKGKMVRIDYDDIDYIESIRNYVAFFKGSVKTIAILNLKDLEEDLSKDDFIRVHKSFIVPVKNIKVIEGNSLKLKNSPVDIPIGATYKEALLEHLGILK